MADNLRKAPKKGILKSSSSFEKTEPYRCGNQKEMKWDEMNILQTLHPPDKDYGLMKIDEPKTPYTHFKEPGQEGARDNDEPHSDDEPDGIDANLLAMKIKLGSTQLPKALIVNDEDDDDDDDEYANETEEQRAKRKLFEKRRREHYNEFYAVKLARKLREEEDEDDDEDDNNVKDDSFNNDSHENDHHNHETISTNRCNENPNSKDTAHLEGD